MKLAVISEIDALITMLERARQPDMAGDPVLRPLIDTLEKAYLDLNEDYRQAILALHRGIDFHLDSNVSDAYSQLAGHLQGLGEPVAAGPAATFSYSYSYSMSLSIPPPTWRNNATAMTITVP